MEDLLEEKVTPRNVYFFVNADKTLALSLATPGIRHCFRHFEQYSAARPCFHDLIPSKRFCPNGDQIAVRSVSALFCGEP